MLEPFDPLAFVQPTIWPPHHTIPMLLVVQVLASVHAPIWPSETTLSTHSVFGPLTTVLFSISPAVHPFPMKGICLEVTFIAGSIGPI